MKFGFVSTAGIGLKALLPGIRRTDHEVLAIASRDADRAAAVAEEHGIPRSYGSYEDLLADDDLDAVYNPLPNAHHAEWTKRAADHGLDVLCEKPMGVDAAEAREMGEYCEAQGVTLMEAFMYRYHPRTERAAEIVREELGEVRAASAAFQFALRGRPDDIRLNPDLVGGTTMDVGCYAINATRLFLGEPNRVYARTADTRDSGVDTHMTATMEYDDEVTARVAASFDTTHVERYRVEATDGFLEATGSAYGPDADEPTTLRWGVDSRVVEETFDPVDQYALEVEHFADCVATDETPLTDAREAAKNMAVVDAIFESAEADVPVDVADPYAD